MTTSGYSLQMLADPGVTAVLMERAAQVNRYGHDPMSERNQPPHRLATIAADYGKIARDRCQPGAAQSLTAARKKAVQSAALWIAAIHVIDHHIAAQAAEQAERAETQTSEPELFNPGEPG